MAVTLSPHLVIYRPVTQHNVPISHLKDVLLCLYWYYPHACALVEAVSLLQFSYTAWDEPAWPKLQWLLEMG